MSPVTPRALSARMRLVASVAVTALLAMLLAIGATAATTPNTYTACLAKAATLYNVAIGTKPSASCAKGDTQISWDQQGPQGPAGTNGTAVLNGTVAPTPGVGNVGDFYINTTAHTLYGPKTTGGWGAGVALVGPQGIQGVAGPSGAPGADGKAGADGAPGPAGTGVLNGSGAPTASVGNDGDFYIDTAGNVLYGPKAAGAWPQSGVSLVGPEGPAGKPGSGGVQDVLVQGVQLASGEAINRDFGSFEVAIGCVGGVPQLSWEGGRMYAYKELGTTTGASASYEENSAGWTALSSTTLKVTYVLWYPGSTPDPRTISLWGTNCSNLVYVESPAVSTVFVPPTYYTVETNSSNGPLDLVEMWDQKVTTQPFAECNGQEFPAWGCETSALAGTDLRVDVTHATAFEYTCPGALKATSSLGDDNQQHGSCTDADLEADFDVRITLKNPPKYSVKATLTSGQVDTVEIWENQGSPTQPLQRCTDVTAGCQWPVAAGTDVGVAVIDESAFQYTCPGGSQQMADFNMGDNKYHAYCANPLLTGDYVVTVQGATPPAQYNVTVSVTAPVVVDTVEIDDETIDPWNPIVLKSCSDVSAAAACNLTGIASDKSISVAIVSASSFNYTCPGGASTGSFYNLGTGLMTGYCALGHLTADVLVTVEPFA